MAVSSAVYAAGYAYITNQGSNDVSVIDLQSDKVIATIPVGKSPVGVAVAPGFSRAFVSNVDGRSISVIDTSSHTVITELPINGSPVGLALSPDNSRLYVEDCFDDRSEERRV